MSGEFRLVSANLRLGDLCPCLPPLERLEKTRSEHVHFVPTEAPSSAPRRLLWADRTLYTLRTFLIVFDLENRFRKERSGFLKGGYERVQLGKANARNWHGDTQACNELAIG